VVDRPLVGRLVRKVLWDSCGRLGVLVGDCGMCWRDVVPFLSGGVCAGMEWER